MNDKPDSLLPAPTDDHDRQLLADVRGHGWHVIMVEADDEGPAFAYSIGLFHTFDHSEVIVFGLDIKVLHRMINAVGEQVRSGEQFGDLDESDEILENYNVIFRNLEREHYPEYFGYARWLYGGDRFSALQCVWPDSQHRFPWHPRFNGRLANRQPILTRDKSWPFSAGANRAVFTTKPVLQDGHPVLLVVHDSDDDWRFLCGTTNRPKDGQVVSLGCMLERDPSLAELAHLPRGSRASRLTAESKWKRRRSAPGRNR